MIGKVKKTIGTPEEAEAIRAVLASGPDAIRWLCEHVRVREWKTLFGEGDEPVVKP